MTFKIATSGSACSTFLQCVKYLNKGMYIYIRSDKIKFSEKKAHDLCIRFNALFTDFVFKLFCSVLLTPFQ